MIWAAMPLLVLLILVGLGLVLWAAIRRRTSAEVLAEKLARGEVSPEEYRERSALLGGSDGGRRRPVLVTGVSLVVAGVVGAVLLVAASTPAIDPWGRMMDRMMGGGMGSMMGGGGGSTPGPSPDPEAEEVRVEAGEFFFRPSTVRVRDGGPVNLVLDNEGRMRHTLTVPDADFELRADGGEQAIGAFDPPEPGRYEVVCTIPGHADAGMRGTIEVSG